MRHRSLPILALALSSALLASSALAGAKSTRGASASALQRGAAPLRAALDPARVRAVPFAIQSIATMPVGPDGMIAAGATIQIDVRVKNPTDTDGTGHETLKLTCTAKSGGSCPFPTQTLPLPAIAKGGSHSVILVAAQAATPGHYELAASATPARRGSGKTAQLKVKGKIQAPGASMATPLRMAAARTGLDAARRSPAASKLMTSDAFRDLAVKVKGEPDWRHTDCGIMGPVEFPHMVFTNTDTVTFPAGSSIIWVMAGKIGEFPLAAPLPPGDSVNGPSFHAWSQPGKPHHCAAVGKL